MTTFEQEINWTKSPLYQKKRIQWSHHDFEQISFVTVRRSRKGTHLNIPEEFYATPVEQPFIARMPVLPFGGCSDMEYVLHKRNSYNRYLQSSQQQMHYKAPPQLSPSVTINIRPTQAYSQPCLYSNGYRKQLSRSTLSINPSLVSEEPWAAKQSIIPTGIHCGCGKTHISSKSSKEQGVIDLEITQERVKDERFVYVTDAPKISPLKSCFSFLYCKRNKKAREVNMPVVLTKNEPHFVCEHCSKTDMTNQSPEGQGDRPRYRPSSRLSTITESELTVSQFSSEEFGVPKETKPMQQSFVSNRTGAYSFIGAPQFGPGGQAISSSGFRWVCQPASPKENVFGKSGPQQYICYKESVKSIK